MCPPSPKANRESCRTTFEGWVQHRQKWSNSGQWARQEYGSLLAPLRGARKYTNILFINIYLGPIIGSIFYTLEIYRELGSLAACAASWALRRRSVNARVSFAPHPRPALLGPTARRGKRPWEPALRPLTASRIPCGLNRNRHLCLCACSASGFKPLGGEAGGRRWRKAFASQTQPIHLGAPPGANSKSRSADLLGANTQINFIYELKIFSGKFFE